MNQGFQGGQPGTPARAAELARLVALAGEIRGCIDRGDWDRSAAAELERRELLERFFAVAPAEAELEAVVAALRDMIRLNAEAIGLAQHRGRALVRELETFGRGRQASNAYLDHAAPVALR
jgi:hypothetical protein